ncbi:uncharacterized protein LOC132056973 isoform X1 [Lycium ferocissimum]|uniref:uncharacterized protein LOC132056973 isoform X1 n=1 Tax=Lycium ferocissimum TaxID=112874 RepID=UPI002814EBD8|nr:uncharacterized protein LOC132056973 isoform X1 [Lycium ferocissimum]
MAENPKGATSAKCFSGIFQRLLCGGSLPTHPSDQFKEQNTTTFDHTSQELPFKDETNISNKVAANSPGIVARLMGLDSLPEEEKPNFGSFSRSRSVNSLDYLMKFNLAENFHHRRVRTSVSFREMPNFDQEFKSEFLVFCFNDEKEKQGFSTIRKSTKVGTQEMKPKNKGQKKVDFAKSSTNMSSAGQKKEVCGKQNRIANKVKKQVKFEDHLRKMSVESKVEKKKSKSKCVVSTKIQPLFNSTDSSPIHHLQQAANPADGNEGKLQLNSRKSPPRVTDPEHAITSKVEKQKDICKETNYYIKVLGEICRLTEEELNESHWIATTTGENFKIEDFEELCEQIGQEVLELLLDQIVHELLIFG